MKILLVIASIIGMFYGIEHKSPTIIIITAIVMGLIYFSAQEDKPHKEADTYGND